VSSEELCILASWFLKMSKNSVLEYLRVRRSAVKSKKICSHPGRDLLKSVLKVRKNSIVTAAFLHHVQIFLLNILTYLFPKFHKNQP